MNDWSHLQVPKLAQKSTDDASKSDEELIDAPQSHDVPLDSKPYFSDGRWCLNVIDSSNQAQILHGTIKLASRRRERFVLEFKCQSHSRYSGKSWGKKYYLCEYCQRAGIFSWIYYRNYVAQHIPRHHPDQCQHCEDCDRPVYTPLVLSHAKLCSRSAAKAKRRKRSAPKFTVLEIPKANDRSRLKDYITGLVTSAKSVADKFETVLAQQGIEVVRGGRRDCIGYPIPTPTVKADESTEETISEESETSDNDHQLFSMSTCCTENQEDGQSFFRNHTFFTADDIDYLYHYSPSLVR